MPISLYTPAPEFSQPLDLLSACHRRIGSMTDMLLKLPGHLASHGADADAGLAAERVLKYFDSAGQHHHDDEEQNLFPLLRAAAILEGNVDILALIEDLEAQHVEMAEAWQALRPFLVLLARHAPVVPEAMPVLRFVTLYRHHIPLEENFLLPYAERTLDAAQIAQLGQAMAERRGVPHSR